MARTELDFGWRQTRSELYEVGCEAVKQWSIREAIHFHVTNISVLTERAEHQDMKFSNHNNSNNEIIVRFLKADQQQGIWANQLTTKHQPKRTCS